MKLNLVLEMRLLCLGCRHKRDVKVNVLTPPEEWMWCPNCGPLDHAKQPGGSKQRRAQERNAAKGGVTIRGIPHRMR
jgi:hypothetical protein